MNSTLLRLVSGAFTNKTNSASAVMAGAAGAAVVAGAVAVGVGVFMGTFRSVLKWIPPGVLRIPPGVVKIRVGV